MIHQLRIYEIFEGTKSAFHERFEQHAWRIMKSYGFDIVAFWDGEEDGKPLFFYLLSWDDEAARDTAWEGFMADEEWKEIKATTAEVHGKFVASIRDHTLVPTPYSPDRIS